MSEGLKPCPFCGRVPRLSSGWTTDGDGWAVVTCHIGLSDSCASMRAERSSKRIAERDAISMWNRRATTITHAVIVSDESTDCATGHCECELCGKPIDMWDKFCRHCGAKVLQPARLGKGE